MRKFAISCLISIVFISTGEAHNPKIWYRQSANNWNEALPIGNGTLGAMIPGSIDKEIIPLNINTFWAGSPHNYSDSIAFKSLPQIRKLLFEGREMEATAFAGKTFMGNPRYQAAYQPLGELRLIFPLKPQNEYYKRSLDLFTGIASVVFRNRGITFKREYFVSYPDRLIVIHLTADKPGQISFNAGLGCEFPNSVQFENENMLVMNGQWQDDGKTKDWAATWKDPGIRFSTVLKVKNNGGKLSEKNGTIHVVNANEVTLYLTSGTSYVNFKNISGDPSAEWPRIIKAASEKKFSILRENQVRDFSRLMRRMSLDICNTESRESMPTDKRINGIKKGENDPGLASIYFQYGRYLLVSCSRPGSQPANLQGIWNKEKSPGWGSKYTTNINLEMNYWPAEVTNLSECSDPVYDLIDDLMNTGAVVAKDYYGCRGWVLHHNTDIWRGAAPVDGVWGIWPMGAAWLVRHSWEHYLYTRDLIFLKTRAWPQMKGAAEFVLDFLTESPKGSFMAGKLITCPSNSPENAYDLQDGSMVGFTYGATMDLEIITDLFRNCLSAMVELEMNNLQTDKDFKAKLELTLDKLAPLQIDAKTGRLLEWISDYKEHETGHRHLSHLYGLYPASLFTPDINPEFALAAQKSLEFRVKNGSGSTGWSRAWLISLFARLKNGDEANFHLKKLLSDYTLPNLFDDGPPFQIDGNFGGTAGIAEMLLQSHNGIISLLPALPVSWHDGEVKGLRTRGGYEVSIKWSRNKLVQASIYSKTGGTCKLGYQTKTKELRLKPGENTFINF